MVSKNLTWEQKDNRKNICSDIMLLLAEKLDLLINVIRCDDPETKCHSIYWKIDTSQRMKKV